MERQHSRQLSWKEATTSTVGDGTSLIERLRHREMGWLPGTGLHKSRELYQNVPLNTHVASIQPPHPCYVKGFSPCGRYLVVFARELDRVILYEYTGGVWTAQPGASVSSTLSVPQTGRSTASMTSSMPLRTSTHGINRTAIPHHRSTRPNAVGDMKFEHFFRHLYDIRPAETGFAMFYRMAMFFHGTIMVVAWDKASDLVDSGALTLMSSVDMATGKIIDSVELVAESVDLSLPNTVSTFKDGQMVVLSPWSLTLLRVDRNGFFSCPQVVGKFCYPDDEELIADVYAGERLTDSRNESDEMYVYDTLKQRLLAYMFFDGRHKSAIDPDAMDVDLPGAFQQSAFYYYFRMVVETELTHAQFLDENRLLLNWGGDYERSVSHSRMPDGIKAIYNIRTTVFEKVFPPFNHTGLNEFIRQDPTHLANTRHPAGVWEQFAMDDGLRCHHAWTQQNVGSSSDIAKSNNSTYVTIQRSEGRQTSPYLDQELFQYDEKSVSKQEGRPVPALRFRTAKFIANAWPSNLKFALDIDKCLHNSSVGRQQHTNEHDVTESIERQINLLYMFHPYDTAVFCVVQTFDEYHGEADVINVFMHT